MKNLLLLSMALLIADGLFCQTEFAPVGAKWWVAEETAFSQTLRIIEYESIGPLDTLGRTYKVVHEKHFDGGERDYYFFQDGDSVFYAYDSLSNFTLIYDYAKQAGESYFIQDWQDTVDVYVDSTGTIDFGNETFSVQYCHAINPNIQFAQSVNQIFEGIGTNSGLWPTLPSELTLETWTHLACFQKPNGELWTISPWLNLDCQALASATTLVPEQDAIFNPNPSSGQATITLPAPLPQPATWHLHDALGREMARAVLSAGQQEAHVELSGVPPGLYFWQVGNGEGTLGTGKLIIAK